MKKFTVKLTDFHGGRIISEHNSIKEAFKVVNKEKLNDCTCGCALIECNSPETEKEYKEYCVEKFGFCVRDF